MPQLLPLREAADAGDAAKAARDAMAQVLRERLALVRALDVDLAALIDQALARIATTLAGAPTDYQQWVLPRLMDSINRVLDELATSAAAKTNDGMRQAWLLGERLVDAPLQAEAAASGTPQASLASPADGLGAVDLRQLRALQQVTTSMISGVTADAVKVINRQLGQVVLGVAAPFEAIKTVGALLPERTRAQVRGIVNLSLAQAFNSASHAKLLAQAERDPALMKQWRRSGKVHSRPNHDAADGQVQAVATPFVLLPGDAKGKSVQLMYPADPAAPVGETINCGCVALPWKATWKMRNPGATLGAKPAAPAPAKKAAAPVKKAANKTTTQDRILQAAAAAGGTLRDPMGQRLVVDERLAPAGIGDARLTKAGQDLYSYWAVQTLRRPTEVWQGEHVDTAAGEVVRTRIYLKKFGANGSTWLGQAHFQFDGKAWRPTKAYQASLVGAAVDQALRDARAGVKVWPTRR